MDLSIDSGMYSCLEKLINKSLDSIEIEGDGSIIKPWASDILDDILNELSIEVK